MLGGELVFATAQAVGVRAEHLWLSAIRIDGYRPPTWPDDAVPKQIHLDLDVEDLARPSLQPSGSAQWRRHSNPHPRRAG